MAELSSPNMRQLLLPRGFAHGLLTLEDVVEVQYKLDRHYNKESEGSGIRFDDPEIGIDWGWDRDFHLSEKDSKAPMLKDSDSDFRFKG
jgi:dTDP-4-dehydrorhamnose 3,5-epimerase